MPIYEFVCDKCEVKKEVIRPMSEARQEEICSCGLRMRRKFSLIDFIIPETGRDKILGTLNQEEGARQFPGGNKHRARYEQAMAKGLDPPRQTVGRGFG